MLSEDRKTIASVLAGNSTDFAELVEKYQRRLLGLMWHACGSRELAEDMTQEAFARAYRSLDSFSGEAQFYTWLSRIAMNALISHRRRKNIENQQSREGFDAAIETEGSVEQPDLKAQKDETKTAVQRAIAMLDEERRQVLLLRDFDGLDYEAISNVLDVPVGTVRSRLHRARRDLREYLAPQAAELGFADHE